MMKIGKIFGKRKDKKSKWFYNTHRQILKIDSIQYSEMRPGYIVTLDMLINQDKN